MANIYRKNLSIDNSITFINKTSDIDIDDIAIVDREGLIINAYILGYGNDYDVTVTDPKLGKSVQRSINLTSLISKPFNLVPDKNGEFSCDVDDETKIKFRYIFEMKKLCTRGKLCKIVQGPQFKNITLK